MDIAGPGAPLVAALGIIGQLTARLLGNMGYKVAHHKG
jgi:hypothetical protein